MFINKTNKTNKQHHKQALKIQELKYKNSVKLHLTALAI